MGFCNTGPDDVFAAVDRYSANRGSTELPHDEVASGQDSCAAVPRSVDIWLNQRTQLVLWLTDGNGEVVVLPPDSDFEIWFAARDTASSATPRLAVTCDSGDKPGELHCDIAPEDTRCGPGVYAAHIVVYNSSREVLYVTPYILSIKARIGGRRRGRNPVTVPEVRMALQDSCAAQNLHLNALEFSDAAILTAMQHAVDEFNESYQPATHYTSRNFPWRYHWLQAVTGYLLRQASHGYMRRHLPYNAGGVAVDDQNKAGPYNAAASQLLAQWRDFIASKKIEININGAFGHFGSPYG